MAEAPTGMARVLLYSTCMYGVQCVVNGLTFLIFHLFILLGFGHHVPSRINNDSTSLLSREI